MIICIFAAIISFVIAAAFVKEDHVLVADIIDVIVFGTISVIVCTYMMSLKCQRFLYARKVSILSETDLLTCVNRVFDREYLGKGYIYVNKCSGKEDV